MPRATYVFHFQCVAVRYAVPERTASAVAQWLVDSIRTRLSDATVDDVRPPLANAAASYFVTVSCHGRPPAEAIATLATADGVNYLGMERIAPN